MAQRIGTIVGAPIVTPDTQDNYPTYYTIDGYGGWKNVATISQRDAIPLERRELGMEVKVVGDATYELIGGLTNAYWQVVAQVGEAFLKNKFYTTSLADLGVTTFAEVTNEIVKDWINSLNIVEEDNTNYYFEITDAEPPIETNIILRGDWASQGITDAESFYDSTYIEGVTDFEIIGEIIAFNIEETSSLNFSYLPITEVIKVNLNNLVELDLSECQISNFNPIGDLSNLNYLNLSGNQIVDFNPSGNFNNLIQLDLGANGITDFNPSGNFSNITILSLVSNQLTNFNPIGDFSNVLVLSLGGNQISNFNPSGNFSSLTDLGLDGNVIIDFNPSGNFYNLTNLVLAGNQITNFNPIGDFSNLTSLVLNGNQIVEFNPSGNFNSINTIYLNSNQLTYFNPNTNLSNITKLYLNSNQIVDFNPSGDFSKITELNLNSNKLTQTSYIQMENFANSLNSGQGTFSFSNNIYNVLLSNLRTILISKGRTVVA